MKKIFGMILVVGLIAGNAFAQVAEGEATTQCVKGNQGGRAQADVKADQSKTKEQEANGQGSGT